MGPVGENFHATMRSRDALAVKKERIWMWKETMFKSDLDFMLIHA